MNLNQRFIIILYKEKKPNSEHPVLYFIYIFRTNIKILYKTKNVKYTCVLMYIMNNNIMNLFAEEVNYKRIRRSLKIKTKDFKFSSPLGRKVANR